MNAQEFKRRTQQFALRIIRVVTALPNTMVATEIGRQLLRAGMSVGANYRAACRARSGNEFIAKMGIVEEECDETIYWMELLILAELVPAQKLKDLLQEAETLGA
jgi:four helix bundle protein